MSSWGPALAGVACSAHGELPPQASFELLLTAAANRSGTFVADEAACKQRCPSLRGRSLFRNGFSPLFFKKKKGTRTYTVQQKGCAERIAPIGTLSQNGYGESSALYTT